MFDNKKLFYSFEKFVIDDIKTYGKPALIYNFLHYEKSINTIDRLEDWTLEQEKFEKQGWTKKCVKKCITINNVKWDCIIWTLQPLNKNGQLNEKKYRGAGGISIDPLAASTGYHITALCYIQFVTIAKP